MGLFFLVFAKLDTFCYPTVQTAPVLRAVVLTQYRRATDRRTDGQTDGIAVASTALAMRRTVKRSSITLNKNSTRAFQRAINQGSTPPLTSSHKVPKFLVFCTISTIKDEKSAEKFHYIKTLSGKVVAQSIVFRVVSIYWLGLLRSLDI